MNVFLEKLKNEHAFNDTQIDDIMKKMKFFINTEQTNLVTKRIFTKSKDVNVCKS